MEFSDLNSDCYSDTDNSYITRDFVYDKKSSYTDITDPGFHRVIRKKKNKSFSLEYYETKNVPNTRMRNAITGFRYLDDDPKFKHMVGTKQENILFKVQISNGETKSGSVLLFYDSPEQFERHQHQDLNTEVKKRWFDKRNDYFNKFSE
jgi:hypothetical protein